ncbi:UmuC protein [Streptomyces sp. NBRC 110611]|uniref:ComEC/Rec2 family competence protein n=1 Tax=Streptomyces sp. NBRC 110611 TaxID=1621259 RepID=UPI00083427B1|nr:MBL fold metallo-hydrolase [Streptomyces sp. NBRC 110611]GAU70687.1 UmuC protein [Streptomyces sp. NBRC 110611]
MAIPTPTRPHIRMIFIGVGQGDCTLIVFPPPPDGTGEVVLIDCGSTKDAKCLIPGPPQRIVSALDNVKEILRTYVPGKAIDYLFITHADEDHYNLIVRALPGYTVKKTFYTGVLEDYWNGRDGARPGNGTYKWMQDHGARPLPNSLAMMGPTPGGDDNTPWRYGQPIVNLGGAGDGLYIVAANATGQYATRYAKWIRYLTPSTDPHEQVRLHKELCRYDPNPDSIVLALDYRQQSVWLMGDATTQTEDFLLRALENPPLSRNGLSSRAGESMTLKMGHHGSETSSGRPLVEFLRPHRLVVSSGTKSFNGTGIPQFAHLEQVKTWSGKVGNFAPHEYTYYKDRAFEIDASDKAVFTTQLMVNPDWTDAMPDEQRFICGNWHLTIDNTGTVEIGF